MKLSCGHRSCELAKNSSGLFLRLKMFAKEGHHYFSLSLHYSLFIKSISSVSLLLGIYHLMAY